MYVMTPFPGRSEEHPESLVQLFQLPLCLDVYGVGRGLCVPGNLRPQVCTDRTVVEVGQPAHPVLVRLRERIVVDIEWIFIPCVDAEADGTGEIGVGGSLPTYCIRPDVPTNPSDSCAQMRCARLTSEVGQRSTP